LGLETLEQTAPNKGAQDAFTQAGLRLGYGICIHAGGRVKDDTVTNPLLARHRLKHPIDHTDMEVHVFVQAGSKRLQVDWTLDTGFERRLANGHAGLNLFVRRMSDVLAHTLELNGSRWVEQRANVGDAMVWGLEADARTGLAWLGLGRDWTLSANASLLQSRMTSGPYERRRIPGQARYVATLTAAKPMPRGGGWYGGTTLTMTRRADQDINATLTGQNRASTMLDFYVGQLVRGLGYWRLGVFNVGDAHFRRDREDASGAVPLISRSRMQWTPRAYLTVGTQF
jgi:hypothetical protein